MLNPIVIKEGTEERIIDVSSVSFVYSPHLNIQDQWVISVLVDQRFIYIVFENEDYAVSAYNNIKSQVIMPPVPQYYVPPSTSTDRSFDQGTSPITISDPPPQDWDGTINWQYIAEHYTPDVPGAGHNTVGFAPYKTN